MKLVLVDDEHLARLRLRSLLAGLPELKVDIVGEAGDAAQALALLQRTAADVVLLDIGMPGLSRHEGLRLAALLKALPQPPALIFVTAHAEHALQAFELEAVDYLTKPVRAERLRDALQRARQRLRVLRADSEPAIDGAVLVFSDRGRVLRLPVAEVLVLKAEQKYVTLRTAAHQYLLDQPLSELEQRLAELGGDFIRIHRNALVARRAIRALELRGGDGAGDSGGERGGGADGSAEHGPATPGGNDGWAVRVAPLDEWLAVSRRQVSAVRAALAGDA